MRSAFDLLRRCQLPGFPLRSRRQFRKGICQNEAGHSALLLTDIGRIEILNAIGLRLFRKELLADEAKKVGDLFRDDAERGVIRVVPLPVAAYARAEQIALKHIPLLGTRPLDVLHVAGALVFRADAFYTFDQKQAALASALGLRVP